MASAMNGSYLVFCGERVESLVRAFPSPLAAFEYARCARDEGVEVTGIGLAGGDVLISAAALAELANLDDAASAGWIAVVHRAIVDK